MEILAVGDLIGSAGIRKLKSVLPELRKKEDIDFVIVNGENSAEGMGMTEKNFKEILEEKVDVITMGNHTWGKKDIFSFIDEDERLVRPANYAEGVCGKGSILLHSKGKKIGIINLIGRVDMGGSYDSPFVAADKEIDKLKKNGADVIIVDFHAEATAEKIALAYYLKDKVNILFGTHTHVQTADEKIYDTGMGYITDVGMTGPKNSIIGMNIEAAMKRFLTQIPERYSCAEGPFMLNGVVFNFDEISKKVTDITRISL